MCGSMVDVQSATAEIRRGKKEDRKKKPRGKNIMSASATQGGHTVWQESCLETVSLPFTNRESRSVVSSPIVVRDGSQAKIDLEHSDFEMRPLC